MNVRMLFISLLLLMRSMHAMYQQETPDHTLGEILTIGSAKSEQILSQSTTKEREKVFLIRSEVEENSLIYRIKPDGISFSRMLNSIFEVSEINPEDAIPIDYPDGQVRLVAELLNFLADNQQHISNNGINHFIIDFIRQRTSNFTTSSFADTLHIINFFDIPVAFNALTEIKQPIPQIPSQQIDYNRQLAYVFNLARQSGETGESNTHCVGSKSLWQLFGRMLYPGCLQHREVQDMIDSISETPGSGMHQSHAKQLIEHIVFGMYMEKFPKLYAHQLQKLNVSWLIWKTVGCVAFSPDGKILASVSYGDKIIRLWRVADGSLIKKITGHTGTVNSIAFSHDGQTLASASADKTICLWRVADGSLMQKIIVQSDPVNLVAFSPDKQTLALVLTNDDIIYLWNIADGSIRKSLIGHTDVVNSVAFSSDGQTLASGSYDGSIFLWRIVDGLLIQKIKGHADSVNSVAFSPDGQTIASGSVDKTICLWRVIDGLLTKKITGRIGVINSVAFSPDGQTLASGSWDYAIRLWRIADGSLIQKITGHKGPVMSVAFSPDEQVLASGSADLTIRLWGYRSLRTALLAPLAMPMPPPEPEEELVVLPAPLPGEKEDEPVVLFDSTYGSMPR